MNARFVDDLVVNMVDVGEETGELDTMLYKVADTYDEEVRTMTDGLMSLLEPLLICLPRLCRRLHRGVAVHAAGRLDFETVVTCGMPCHCRGRFATAETAAVTRETRNQDTETGGMER